MNKDLLAAPLTLSGGDVHNCAKAPGHDGGAGVAFANAGGGFARDYVDFGRVAMPKEGFTLRLWLKTERGGCGGWCGVEEWMPPGDWADVDGRTACQRGRGGVLAASMPLYGAGDGFQLCLFQPRAYLTFRVRRNGREWQAAGLRQACDDRWHMLSLVIAPGAFRAYVDADEVGAADIEGAPAGAGAADFPLVLGADTLGKNGAGVCAVSGFVMEAGALSPARIAEYYYEGALKALLMEISARNLPQCPLYDQAAARAFIDGVNAAAGERGGAAGRYRRIRAEYEAFLLRTKPPEGKFLLLSDVHCDGSGGARTAAFEKALRWAAALDMDAVVDCGDYSAMGERGELDSYWQALEAYFPGKPVCVAPGNHETLALKCHELVDYHTGQLKKRGLVPPDWEKLYYEGRVGQCPVLVLSQYSDTYTVTGRNRMWRHAGEIKQEQLDWLAQRLEAYCGAGRPVFVTIHNAHRGLLDAQTGGRFAEDSVLIDAAELYQLLRGRADVILCTGHVHHGFGAACGLGRVADGYAVLDVPGFKGTAYGYGTNNNATGGRRHSGYFCYLYSDALLLRAADFVSGEWLTAYDQYMTC